MKYFLMALSLCAASTHARDITEIYRSEMGVRSLRPQKSAPTRATPRTSVVVEKFKKVIGEEPQKLQPRKKRKVVTNRWQTHKLIDWDSKKKKKRRRRWRKKRRRR